MAANKEAAKAAAVVAGIFYFVFASCLLFG
jgi:hypothetical protein